MALDLSNYLASRLIAAGPSRGPYAGIASGLQNAFARFNAKQDAADVAATEHSNKLMQLERAHGYDMELQGLKSGTATLPQNPVQILPPEAAGMDPKTWKLGVQDDRVSYGFLNPIRNTKTGVVYLTPSLKQINDPFGTFNAESLQDSGEVGADGMTDAEREIYQSIFQRR